MCWGMAIAKSYWPHDVENAVLAISARAPPAHPIGFIPRVSPASKKCLESCLSQSQAQLAVREKWNLYLLKEISKGRKQEGKRGGGGRNPTHIRRERKKKISPFTWDIHFRGSCT